MLPDQQGLHDAIERLYAVFARYPLQKVIVSTSCCITTQDHAQLHAKPLRDLTAQDLERFASEALLDWGDENDFRHFLPRLFELVANEGIVGCVDLENVFKKLEYGGWRAWPEDERNALLTYFAALWQALLMTRPDQSALDTNSCLCGIGLVVDDLSPYLQMWIQAASESAFLHLSDLLENHCYHSGEIGLIFVGNSWWSESKAQQLTRWLTDPHTSEVLEQRFFEAGNSALAAALASAYDALQSLMR